MAFQDATRRKMLPLPAQASVVGGGNVVTWDIPKTGLLAAIHLSIRCVTTAGACAAPNIYGFCAAIRRVRLISNSGIDLFNVTGPGYFYLLQNMLEHYQPVTPQNAGQTAVAINQTVNLDMIVPVALNARDSVGLFMLQNEQTLVQLSVEFETTLILGGVACDAITTVCPWVEYFTVPVDVKDWPPLNVVQQILEDDRAIVAVGDLDYSWPRGNTYIQVAHAYGCLQAGSADNWTRAILLVNQSETLIDLTPAGMILEWNRSHGFARALGVCLMDLMGTSGLGTMGSSRDLLYSAMVTELTTRITIGAQPFLLRSIRRQLVALR